MDRIKAFMKPLPKAGEKSKATLLTLKLWTRAKPDDVEDVIKDHEQGLGPHDFKPDELASDSARVTDNWDDEHHWTLNRVLQDLVPGDPEHSERSQAGFKTALEILEKGTTKRWKLITGRQRKSERVTVPTGLNPAQFRNWLITNQMWKKGFLVEFNPGDPGYDDSEMLRLDRPLNARDWRNIAQYDQGYRVITGTIDPGLNAASPVKTDDFGKNGLGSPATGPRMRGILDIFNLLCDPVAKSIETLDTMVNAQLEEGARASVKDVRKALDDKKLMGRGDTILKALEGVASRLEMDPRKKPNPDNAKKRVASGLRFVGIDEGDTADEDDLDAPHLDETMFLRIKLAEVLVKIGRGHKPVKTEQWGKRNLVTKIKGYWDYERDASGNLILDAQGLQKPVFVEFEGYIVTRRAFVSLSFYEVAEWILEAQKTSVVMVKNTLLGFLQSGEKSKYPLVPDLTVLGMGAAVATIIFLVVAAGVDPLVGIILGIGALILFSTLFRVDDREHMTSGEEWRTAIGAAIVLVVIFGSLLVHSAAHSSQVAASQSRTDQYMINIGLATREKLDEWSQQEQAFHQAVDNAAQRDNADKAKQPSGWLSWLNAQWALAIVIGGIAVGLAWLIYSQRRRDNYDPIKARQGWWKRLTQP